MARVDVNQFDLVTAVIALIRSYFSLEKSHVMLTTDPLAVRIPRGGDRWFSVSVGDGVFADDLMTGGVVEQLREDGTFTVTGYNRLHLDETDSDEQVLLQATAGLLVLKKEILACFAGEDPQVGGNEVLRELIRPKTATAPGVMNPLDEDGQSVEIPVGMIGITFSSVFDWSLS